MPCCSTTRLQQGCLQVCSLSRLPNNLNKSYICIYCSRNFRFSNFHVQQKQTHRFANRFCCDCSWHVYVSIFFLAPRYLTWLSKIDSDNSLFCWSLTSNMCFLPFPLGRHDVFSCLSPCRILLGNMCQKTRAAETSRYPIQWDNSSVLWLQVTSKRKTW